MRGQPDFGAYAAKEVTATLADMGELAARLGSIIIYDKRGDVVDFDNFEEPVLRWKTTLGADGGYVRLDTSTSRSGIQSAKLHTAPAASDIVYINKKFPVLGSLKLGAEISFCKLLETHQLVFYLSYYTGAKVYNAGFYVDFNVGKAFVYSTDEAWVEVVSGLTASNTDYFFDTIKIVADFSTGYYKRLLFNSVEYDISSTPIRETGTELAPYLEAEFSLRNRNSVAGDVWLDDYILTQAEP